MANGNSHTEPTGQTETSEAPEYFEQYWRYSTVVRNWLVAFGGGCCVLLISEKADIFREVSTQKKVDIVFWLLVGVILQILLAILNKYIHWCVYRGKEDEKFSKGRCFEMACKICNWIWIDVLVDALTVIFFALAICKMFGCRT